MRPLALTFTAFGSYGGTTSIDFDRLGRHGVFAITGSTGAGKTTIFDAMTFALFGELSSGRSIDDFRSDHADPTVTTAVTFRFEVRGEQWEISRTPAQLRARKRGPGDPVPVPARVTLQRGEATAGGLSRAADVKAKVSELIGLSAAQFNQVILLPQGAFEEVLRCDTTQRAELLKRLFPVDVYRRVTERLKAEADRRREELEQVRGQVQAVGDQVRRDLAAAAALLEPYVDVGLAVGRPHEECGEAEFDVERLGPMVAALRAGRDGLEARLTEAQGRARAARSAAESHLAAVARFDQWTTNVAAHRRFPVEEAADAERHEALDRARTLLHLSPSLLALTEAGGQLAATAPAHLARLTELGSHGTGRFDRRALTDAMAAIERAATLEAEADALADALIDAGLLTGMEKAVADQEASIDHDRAELADAVGILEAGVVEHRRCGTAVADLERRVGDAGQAQDRVETLTDERSRAMARASAASAVSDLEREVLRRSGEVEQATLHLETTRAAWRAGLAARLSVDLADGAACPTCGSTEHPHLASTNADIVEDGAVEAAEAALARAGASRAEGKEALAAQRAVAESDGRPVEAVETELAAAVRAGVRVGQAQQDLATERMRLTDLTGRMDEERERQALARQRLAVADTELTASRREAAQMRKRLIGRHGTTEFDPAAPLQRRSVAGRWKEHAVSLTARGQLETRAEAAARCLAPTVEAWGLESAEALDGFRMDAGEIRIGQAGLQERADRRRRIVDELEAYERDGGPTERPAEAGLIEAAHAREAARDQLVRTKALVDDKVDALDQVPARLAGVASELAEATLAFEEARELAVLCEGGRGGGTVRISLENWVLAEYLREVLDQANLRLLSLTAGRYWLDVATAAGNRRSATGLDLAVFDGDTGAARSASTLSGGESFLASVALALGLADVVAGRSNHEVGALFIDEGFGALDVEFLEAMLDVLASLQNGGRMVGVISHVEGLQAAIPTGIEVVRTPSGSRVIPHYPGD